LARDLDTEALQTDNFAGMIRQKVYSGQPQVGENLGADTCFVL
jgi:hypothetical protein